MRSGGGLVLGMLILAAACVPPAAAPAPADPTEMPVRGGRLVVSGAELPRYQPAIDGPTNAAGIVYETFVQFDPDTGEILPGFGTLSQSPDGLTYAVLIDPRALWSDGTPITAADWLTAVKAIARVETAGDWLNEFNEITQIVGFQEYAARTSEEIPGIRADGQRLSVTFERVLCSARTAFAVIPPLPAHVFGKYVQPGGAGIMDAPENVMPPVASGPFRLSEWRKGDHIVFARNERYWRGAPLLDEFVVKFTARPGETPTIDKRLEQLEAGEVMGIGVPAQELNRFENLDGITIQRYTPPGFTYIGWNTQSEKVPALRDVRVREALGLAFDWDLVIERLGAHTRRVDSYMPSSSWAYVPVASVRHDPERAVELLRAAGYAKNSSGIYEKDGQPIAFDLVTNENNGLRVAIVQLAADEYAKFGIRVTAKLEPFAPLVEKLVRGEADAWVIGFEFGPDPDQRGLWHSSFIRDSTATAARGGNLSRLVNAELDRALDEVASPSDGECSRESRKRHYENIARILTEAHPGSLGMVSDSFQAWTADLRGFRIGPYSYRFYRPDMHLWWLAPDGR